MTYQGFFLRPGCCSTHCLSAVNTRHFSDADHLAQPQLCFVHYSYHVKHVFFSWCPQPLGIIGQFLIFSVHVEPNASFSFWLLSLRGEYISTMFRISSRSYEEPTPVALPKYSRIGSTPLKGNTQWKPSLQSIKNGIFSRKKPTQDQGVHLPQIKTQNTRYRPPIRLNDQTPTRRDGRPRDISIAPLEVSYSLTQSRQRPKGPREPPPPKGLNFIKRSLTKSKRFSDTNQAAPAPKTDQAQKIHEPKIAPPRRKSTIKRTLTLATSQTSSSPYKLPVTSSARSMSVAYVLQHAAADFLRDTQATKLMNHDSTTRAKPSSAYVPKHAPTASLRKSVLPETDHHNVLISQFTQNYIQLDEPASVLPTPPPDSSDYYDFLEQSHRAQMKTHYSCWNWQILSEVSKFMDERIATHTAKETGRRMSMSQRSTTSRPVNRAGSFVENIGEYFKPSRLESIYD